MELFTGEKRKQKNKMKKKTKIIIGILIAAVIAAAGITWYVMNQKNQKTGNSSAEVVAWDVDIEEEEPSEEKGILIPGYTSMVMKANTKEQTVSIGNPADNDCIFVIVLKLEDGTKLFESQELKPGEGLENITLDQELEAGEYQAVIEYKCYSLAVTYVDGRTVKEFEDAIRPETKMIILESPTTLLFNVVDLEGVAKLAKEHGIKTYIDNTYSTPIFQKPLDMGIDIVMHTMTKYIGGHSDLVGGVLVSKDEEFMREIMVQRDWFGGVLGPMEAWLAIRGLRTLDVRMQRHYETAMEVAKFLEKQPKIKRVFFTGLESHPQYELARKQQKGECGLMSLEIDGTLEETETFVNSLKLFEKGCSWGGFESLAIAYTYNWTEEQCAFLNVSRNIVRIHCGLEGTENLIADLQQALDKIS